MKLLPAFSYPERLLAWRILRAKRQDGFISLISIFSFIGIALGVATLIIVMAVMNGFRIELVNHILGVNGHVNVAMYGKDIQNYDNILEKISKIKGVKNANGMIEAQIMATANNRNAGIVVRGHKFTDNIEDHLVTQKTKSGDLQDLINGDLAIGKRLADKLGVRVGDNLTLISPRGRVTPFGTAPRIKPYRVGLIFELGMSLYDENFVFMNLDAAQEFFLKGNGVSSLDIHLEDMNKADIVRDQISLMLQGSFLLSTWQESNATYLSALAIERNVMFVILSLIILVAALNIISSMIMLVKDKRKDIAILKTIGMGKNAILRIFFMAGAAIGISGTLTGLVIGTLFCFNIENIRQGISNLLGVSLFDPNIYFLAKMPAEMTLSDVTYVVILSLSLTLLAVIYPAKRAAKLEPADILRHE